MIISLAFVAPHQNARMRHLIISHRQVALNVSAPTHTYIHSHNKCICMYVHWLRLHRRTPALPHTRTPTNTHTYMHACTYILIHISIRIEQQRTWNYVRPAVALLALNGFFMINRAFAAVHNRNGIERQWLACIWSHRTEIRSALDAIKRWLHLNLCRYVPVRVVHTEICMKNRLLPVQKTRKMFYFAS